MSPPKPTAAPTAMRAPLFSASLLSAGKISAALTTALGMRMLSPGAAERFSCLRSESGGGVGVATVSMGRAASVIGTHTERSVLPCVTMDSTSKR